MNECHNVLYFSWHEMFAIVVVEISRVCLPTKAGVDGSDYINATFLQV